MSIHSAFFLLMDLWNKNMLNSRARAYDGLKRLLYGEIKRQAFQLMNVTSVEKTFKAAQLHTLPPSFESKCQKEWQSAS